MASLEAGRGGPHARPQPERHQPGNGDYQLSASQPRCVDSLYQGVVYAATLISANDALGNSRR